MKKNVLVLLMVTAFLAVACTNNEESNGQPLAVEDTGIQTGESNAHELRTEELNTSESQIGESNTCETTEVTTEVEQNENDTVCEAGVQAFDSGSLIDLDGDGTKEQLLYQKNEHEEFEDIYVPTLQILSENESGTDPDKEVSVTPEGSYFCHDTVYVMTMDGIHFYPIIADFGASADDAMYIYEYAAGEIKEVGMIYEDPNDIKVYPDRIEASERADHIHSQYVTFTYVLENGKFVKQNEDYYEYSSKVVTVIEDYNYYQDKDRSTEALLLHKGEEIEILGGDQKEWVLFQKVSTGEEGWLYVLPPGECILPDGSKVYSDQVFEGLDFFG